MEWYARECDGVWGCQWAQICSLTMLHVSHPYLVFLYFTVALQSVGYAALL